jgi:hypothetical protein
MYGQPYAPAVDKADRFLRDRPNIRRVSFFAGSSLLVNTNRKFAELMTKVSSIIVVINKSKEQCDSIVQQLTEYSRENSGAMVIGVVDTIGEFIARLKRCTACAGSSGSAFVFGGTIGGINPVIGAQAGAVQERVVQKKAADARQAAVDSFAVKHGLVTPLHSNTKSQLEDSFKAEWNVRLSMTKMASESARKAKRSARGQRGTAGLAWAFVLKTNIQKAVAAAYWDLPVPGRGDVPLQWRC